MGDILSDDDKPRHFKAGSGFFFNLTFAKPLPRGASPRLTVSGPDGTNQATFDAGSLAAGETQSVRIDGSIPENAPPGTYRISRVFVVWAGSPSNWKPVDLDFSHLGEDATMIVEPPDRPSQPSVPPLTDLD